MPAMGSAKAIMLLTVCLCLGGCDEEGKVERAQKEMKSWRGTVTLVAKQWVDERVPTTYLKQVIKAADEALDQREKDLRKAGRPEVLAQIKAFRAGLKELSAAVEKKDGAAVMRGAAEVAGGGG
jgi:hypothetical protein